MAPKNLHVPQLEHLRRGGPVDPKLLYEALDRIVKHINEQNTSTATAATDSSKEGS